MADPHEHGQHPHDGHLHLHRVSPDDWESHRDLRLEMLEDAPDAFWFTYADEAAYDEADWRQQIEGAWLVQAQDADGVLGSAGLGSHGSPSAPRPQRFSACTSPRGPEVVVSVRRSFRPSSTRRVA